jgi:uncharacterized glyoxalase superfamily protein PhnB
MKPPPKGWPRLAVTLFYRDPASAIEWLCKAFDLKVRTKVQGSDGAIHHCELTIGEGAGEAVIMVGGESDHDPRKERGIHKSPASLSSANTSGLLIYVDDADAHCARAREAGAKITVGPLTTDFGPGYWSDRIYQAEDPEGHRWYFAHRIKDN